MTGLWISLASVAATLVVVWLFANLLNTEKAVMHRVEHLHGVEHPQFTHAMSVLLGPPIIGGNRFETLLNGVQIFPSMLDAVRSAERTIVFETFIYWSGEIGRRFADALVERARAGVKVHVILDWVGTNKMDHAILEELTDASIQVVRYHPLRWTGLGKLNNRTHRKLLVVDGRIGFTGGVGIASPWTGDAQDPDHWRDTHFKVEGPVVAQMQAAFMDNWIETTGRALHDADYFPMVEPVGDGRAQMFVSSANGGSASMELMYLMTIAAATRTIDLSSSYFVPSPVAIRELVAAMARGVRVRIVTPGPYIDSETVRKASRAKWGPLLAAGAEMYEYAPTMYHVKLMIVDDFLVSAGSTNFDARSFRLNDEANLNIYDRAFATAQTAVFEADIARSTRITPERWKRRPWTERIVERAASLLDTQL